MLAEQTLFGWNDKVATAIERLREHEPPEGYYLAFSGGKDSVTIKALADMAGVKYDAHYSLTTVDPPELVRFTKREHPDVVIDKPKYTMWQLISRTTIPPTRLARYCCRYLKETGGKGRVIVTGIRRAESNKRAKREIYEVSKTRANTIMLHPIFDWDDSDVWEFIKINKIPYCCLYDEGYTRLGCIGCPMVGTKGQQKDFERWPKYKRGYLRAFGNMLNTRKEKGGSIGNWETPQQVMDWWMQASGRGGVAQCDDDQGTLFD